MTINERLRQLRIDAEASQDELAGWLGVGRGSVSGWETGRFREIELTTLRRYCRVFRMPLSELLEGIE